MFLKPLAIAAAHSAKNNNMRRPILQIVLLMVLKEPKLAWQVNRYLMRFPRIHGYLRSVAVDNQLMPMSPTIPFETSASATAGLIPSDINSCPRRVRAIYKALDLGLRHIKRSS